MANICVVESSVVSPYYSQELPADCLVLANMSNDWQPLGFIILHSYRPECNVEIGVVTTKQGISRPLIAFTFNYIFEQLKLPRATIVVRADSYSQHRIVQQLGGILEGTFDHWFGFGHKGAQYKFTLESVTASKFGRVLHAYRNKCQTA